MFLSKEFLGGAVVSELEDIIQNLSFVLGSKRGTGYFIESFGTSDIGFRTPEEMVLSIIAEIRENARLFEPRVEVIDVDEDWDAKGRRTRIVVRLRHRESHEKLEVVVDLGSRKFDVVAVKTRAPR